MEEQDTIKCVKCFWKSEDRSTKTKYKLISKLNERCKNEIYTIMREVWSFWKKNKRIMKIQLIVWVVSEWKVKWYSENNKIQ